MNSSTVHAPLQQSSDNLVCDICDVKCSSLTSLDMHYDELAHKSRATGLAKCLFGYLPGKKIRVTCLDDLFNHPKKNGTFIGLHYLRNWTRGEKMVFACSLCDVACSTMFQHLVSVKHKKTYIERHYQFIFRDYKSFSTQDIETIAVAIEKVEGVERFKEAIKYPTRRANMSDDSFRQTLQKVVEQLKTMGFACEYPYSHPNERQNLILIKPIKRPKPPSAAENAARQARNRGININASVPAKSSVDSKTTSKQNDDKTDQQQNHGVDRKDARQGQNAVPSLQTGSHASAVNENSSKRPLQYKPYEAFKRRKSELTSQYTGKPIISLSNPVPAPFSVPQPSVGVMLGNNMQGYNTQPATKMPIASYAPPVNQGLASKHMPSLWSSHSASYQTIWPLAGEYFPSWPSAVSFYQSVVQGYGNYSNPSFRGFGNTSTYSQASSVSDAGKAYAFEDHTRRRETGHPLGTVGGSVSSLTGPTSSVASLKRDAPPSYHSISDRKELVPKSSSPSEDTPVLHKEPSLPKSHGDSPPSKGLSPTTTRTSSPAQTTQSTNSDLPVKAASVLSPHTLKILQGREPESVKSILRRLSEYCPELKEVNISLLVDVLFQTGVLR